MLTKFKHMLLAVIIAQVNTEIIMTIKIINKNVNQILRLSD
jgi:hypothetical protein